MLDDLAIDSDVLLRFFTQELTLASWTSMLHWPEIAFEAMMSWVQV